MSPRGAALLLSCPVPAVKNDVATAELNRRQLDRKDFAEALQKKVYLHRPSTYANYVSLLIFLKFTQFISVSFLNRTELIFSILVLRCTAR